MIDDVTLTARLSAPVILEGPTVPRHRTDPSGRSFTWHVACGPAVAVAVCDETQDIEVRLSFPRLANHHPCNFPLRRTTDVNLAEAAREVAALVGGEVFVVAGELQQWGVRRIAFAVDPEVDDVPRVLEPLAARPRRGSAPQRWGYPARGLQWDGANVRLQLYKKSDEILNRIRHLRRQQGDLQKGSVELRRDLARRAARVLRWEVTLKNAKGIRTLLNIPGGWLPRLRPFLDDEIGAYVLGREFTKLKLDTVVEQPDASQGPDVLALARAIGEAARRAPPRRNGRRLQGIRIMAAGFLHQIYSLADDADLQATLGVSARAYADLRRDLQRIGMPPLGTTDPSGHGYVARFAEAMRNEVVEFPPWLSAPLRDEDLVRAPWADRLPSGYLDPQTNQPLFLEHGHDGTARSTVVEIHIGQKEEANEADWERIRQAVNAIDADEIPDPEGTVDDEGRPVMIPNPYNVVVSVMMLKEGWDVRNVKVIVPLRPCDSRTLTEQTLGRGLRKMHPPILDDEGAAELQPEDLYVIEHPSFRAIIDQIRDIIDEKSSDEIEHSREYVPILQNPDEQAREGVDVRLVRFEGLIQAQADWRKHFDFNKVAPLTPKIPWMEEMPETEIHTFLKKALDQGEHEGQTFSLPSNPSYRNFDHVVEVAYAIPILKDLKASYQHKTAVKDVVRMFLERKTFAVPAGMPISFDKVIEVGDARVALGNLARPEVIERVRHALLPVLHEALSAERPSAEALLSKRRAAELRSYQALKKNVLPNLKKSTFTSAAFDSKEELRVAVLLDDAADVVGWVYNHRSGVGYSIEYDWQGFTARYFPDFICRAKFGEVFHNFIIEVKGRLDERDKAKARRGRRYCELLTEYDQEPWHYLLLLENQQENRSDITWWDQRSVHEIAHLLRHHENLPFLPKGSSQPPGAPTLTVLPSVADNEKYQSAVPVYDLAVAAGGFSDAQAPETKGWAKVHTARQLDKRTFVARVLGHSMEDGIPDGSWGLFRTWPVGSAPSATALDGRRVVVQLRDATDPDTGGQYTLKRWKVTKRTADAGVQEVELRPDNPAFKTMKFSATEGDIRAVAEFLEVVG